MTNIASINRLEKAVIHHDFEMACHELLSILATVDRAFGHYGAIECNYPTSLEYADKERAAHFCNRVADCITRLFDARNDFVLSEDEFTRFMAYHRWISIIFGSSSYINADHILRSYNAANTGSSNPSNDDTFYINNDLNTWRKFCILYTLESVVSLNLDVLWEIDSKLCASLCLAMQASRFIATDDAFAKRNVILKWLPDKLTQLDSLFGLPANILHDVYMHCSYDTDPDKHRIKKSLNHLIRQHMELEGVTDSDVSDIRLIHGKPVMFVVLEQFYSFHSIYRTHSTSIAAAREYFYIIGFGDANVDEVGSAVFDEFYYYPDEMILDRIDFIQAKAQAFKPAVLYMPSIGMDLTTMFVSNLRIAPIQSIALGHPATTHSDHIDYVIVEDDYVGSEDCFSEALIRLPKDALPYVPSSQAPESVSCQLRANPSVVQIGIAAATMKFNPYFLQACRRILDESSVPVHFHFVVAGLSGVYIPYVSRFIETYLSGHATLYTARPYKDYLEVLSQCDMLINPFPFGNTNGVIDMVMLGLVGVCKTGDEVHEHIDEALFARLGLPTEDLVADSVDDYVAKAIHLAQNHEKRIQMRRHIIENNGLSTLFTGDARPMGEAFVAKLIDRGILTL